MKNQVVSYLLMSHLTKGCKPTVKETNRKHCNTCWVLPTCQHKHKGQCLL